MRAQREFAGNVAHELRTPLAGIRALADYGLAQTSPAVWREQLERIAQSQSRASHLVDQLLALPVRSGPDFVVFLLGRRGDDFTQDDVDLLRALRPAMSALATILEPELLPEPAADQVAKGKGTDWNDYEASHGRAATRAALRTAGLQELAAQDARMAAKARAGERQGAGLSA